ncbi:hypothetical protein N0V83_000117 [Neocucurbitaria cava]|uniref:Uncharacterized protein n=1 Tax=Neocucurbitaria cava TaxID=798079 RepID=A0A9W8YI25_9PLEO|nr:hypothetical protein N0V83_000117 [Neocucurbitaria cava]
MSYILVQSILRRSWFTTAETALWSKALVTSATKYPYLQHCMFSLAYLRRDLFEQPIDGMSVDAYQHQLTASTLFRQGAPVVDAENWIAIVAFHVFMLLFQFATQSTCAEADFNLINTLHILRSSNAVEEQAKPFFEKSQYWELIIKRTTTLPYEVDSTLKTNLQALAGVIAEMLENDANDPDDEERAEINRQACAELREWVFSCDAHPRRWNQYCSWPGRVTPEFLDLLADRDDVALLLVIHWCAVLHRSPKPSVYKWAHRAACYALDNLSDRSRWENLLAWPLQTFREPRNDRIFEARLAKDLQLSSVLPRDALVVSAGPTDSSTWSSSERLQAGTMTNGSHGASALMLFGGSIGPFDDSFITRTTGRVDPSLLASTPGMLHTTTIPGLMDSFNISHDPTTLSNTTGDVNMAHFYDTPASMSFDMEVDYIPSQRSFSQQTS